MTADDELEWDDLRYFLRAVQSGTLAGVCRRSSVRSAHRWSFAGPRAFISRHSAKAWCRWSKRWGV